MAKNRLKKGEKCDTFRFMSAGTREAQKAQRE